MSSLRNAYSRVTDSEAGILLRAMTDDGIIGTNSNAAVDGSSTPVKFFIQPLQTTEFLVSQVAIEISSSGNPGIDDYGSITGPLTNGLQFFTEIDGVEADFGGPLKSNREVIQLFPNFQEVMFAGSIELRVYTFDVLAHSKSPIRLNGNTFDKFGVIVQDNLSSLVDHSISCKGNIRLINV